MALTLQKLNHITYLTNNISATISFYRDILGMKLVAAERRPLTATDLTFPSDTEGQSLDESAYKEQLTIVFEMKNGSRFAFMEVDGLSEWPSNPLPRWIKHLAMKVASEDELRQAKAELEGRGINVLGITDHGLFHSIYFFDPVNDVRLEYAWNTDELDETDSEAAWQALEIWKNGGVPQNKKIH